MTSPLQILPADEAQLRISRVATKMQEAGIDAAILTDNATKFHLTGRVFAGWIMLTSDGILTAYVRRPVGLTGEEVKYIRKPEEITLPQGVDSVGLEYSTLCVSDYLRLTAALGTRKYCDVSGILRQARAVKTPYEIDLMEISGRKQTEVYRQIPQMFTPGMTDLQLQIALERALRLAGCIGQFRISGNSMELFMGNILVGDNADNPTPYDFAMGGAGTHPSLPVGADGSIIEPGKCVMVDANGNFTGYMTDMTRTFACGEVSEQARLAHQCSIDICHALAEVGRPGEKASRLYEIAHEIATEAGLADRFMGHNQKAGFVGHGVGIEVNELPVIAPRSRDILAQGNVIALEPKFVIAGAGAVGIENTYVVTANGPMRCITLAPEALLPIC